MEAIYSSEMLIDFQLTPRRHISEDSDILISFPSSSIKGGDEIIRFQYILLK
jgi:hypothetical protein